jgi:hypothetical protein
MFSYEITGNMLKRYADGRTTVIYRWGDVSEGAGGHGTSREPSRTGCEQPDSVHVAL